MYMDVYFHVPKAFGLKRIGIDPPTQDIVAQGIWVEADRAQSVRVQAILPPPIVVQEVLAQEYASRKCQKSSKKHPGSIQ